MKWLVVLALFWASVAQVQAQTCHGTALVHPPDMSWCWGDGPPPGPAPFTACASGNGINQRNTFAWSNITCNGVRCLSQCDRFPVTATEFGIGLVRWNVPPLPVGAVVTSGSMAFQIAGGSQEDNLAAWAEWYHDFVFPGTIADYSTVPSNSAFNLGPINNLLTVCPGANCVVAVNDVAQIPTTGGVTVLRLWLSSSTFTSCNGWEMYGQLNGADAILTVNYDYPCSADTPTPGTPTATMTVPIATQTANAQATQTRGAQATQTQNTQETQTAAPTSTAIFTVTGTVPPTATATRTPTPNPQTGCCVCPSMCTELTVGQGCVVPCVFGGPGTVCVQVQ